MGESEAEFRFAMALPMVGLSVVLLVRHAGGLAAVSAALAFTFYFLGLMRQRQVEDQLLTLLEAGVIPSEPIDRLRKGEVYYLSIGRAAAT